MASDAMEITNPPSLPKSIYKDPDDDGRQRFLLEREFVQCLANPTYIHYLAQNRYFEDEAFIGYLKYLQYWQRPEYIKFVMYPYCLFFLELLQNSNFRNAMAHPVNKAAILLLENYRNNRLKHILLKQPSEPAGASSAAPPPPLLPTAITATPASSVSPPVPSPVAPQVPSPMQLQYGSGPGTAFVKNETRSTGLDKRKRK